MNLDIYIEVMFQMLHFQFGSEDIGDGGENRNLGKRLEWRDRDET